MLGGEDDIVISMLGKEWISGTNDDEEVTIYFREPENLNVQLSRHKLMLIVIGNLQTLRNSAAEVAQPAKATHRGKPRGLSAEAKRIHITIDTLLRLAGISANENILKPSEGKYAMFMKVDQ